MTRKHTRLILLLFPVLVLFANITTHEWAHQEIFSAYDIDSTIHYNAAGIYNPNAPIAYTKPDGDDWKNATSFERSEVIKLNAMNEIVGYPFGIVIILLSLILTFQMFRLFGDLNEN